MRDVKFRGLNMNGEWVYGDLVNATGLKHKPKQNTKTWIVTSAFGNGGWFMIRGRQYVKPDTVGQFTGLHDSSFMTPIYEGDIIEFIQHHFNTSMTKIKKIVVAWNDTKGTWNINETAAGRSGIKVVGNIHNNPELLD